jgi:3-deoxy-D-manno-octulosonic-acid transferase
MQNFRAIAQQFTSAGACVQVRDAGELRRAVQELLENAERQHSIVAAAHRVIRSNVGATDRCIELIAENLRKTQSGVTSLSAAR